MEGKYTSPFGERYGKDMAELFSEEHKIVVWRRLWCQLAKAEMHLGLPITEEQVDEMENMVYGADLNRAKEIEKTTHHDVVAHIRHYVEQCPKAAPIIHLGATSCYVTDNTDVIFMHSALRRIRHKLTALSANLYSMAAEYMSLPALAYTHFQPAQPTTFGKRAIMWAQDLDMDILNVSFQLDNMKMLGCKGATGTADSFLKLFDGDIRKVEKLEQEICEQWGFNAFPISGQTYTRKQDYYVLQVLSGMAQTASKIATDIRLLSGFGEVYESFSTGQVGSSAMPYKRNPITCERACALSRYIICGVQNTAITASAQWLERTLDDSANRRVVIPEMFIAADEILESLTSVIENLVVDEVRIGDRLDAELSHVSMERILMASVKAGGDRQKLHEKLNQYTSQYHGPELLRKIEEDPDFVVDEDCTDISRMVGMAAHQVREYLHA